MKIDITMGTKGRFQQFKRVIQSLNDQKNVGDLNLLVMDGNDNDDVKNFLGGDWRFNKIVIFKEKEVMKEKDWGLWPRIYNFLMKKGDGDLVTYWSDDVYPDHACFTLASKKFKHKRVGAIAFSWRDGEGRPYTIYGTEMHKQVMVNFGLFRRSVLRHAGYIDERYHFYFADQDLSLKVWYLGYTVMRCKECRVTHLTCKKSKNKYRAGKYHNSDRELFYRKWAYNTVKKRKVKI